MTVSQQRFLGSSIISFSQSMGWNETPSQVIVTLVDDPDMGDSFSPGYVGRPVTLTIGGSNTFTGIIQSFSDTISSGGFIHEVVLSDPREILAGVPLILDGYTGSVLSLPNLQNVYGYLESFGFGSSQKNETGIPWKNIRDAVHALTNLSQQGDYGGPIYFIQSRYIVDLSLLPNIPDDYRVGGDSISILDFIGEVCEAGGCDYSVRMVETSTGIFVIQVNTVSRTSAIDYGAVTEFLNSITEYEGKSAGRELANDTTAKFLVGGPIRELWYQPYDGTSSTVWQYWGLDINGNPNVGTGYGDDHEVVLDSRSVNNPRVGPFYITNVGEIRAVLAGRANWETFLMLHRGDGGIHSNKVTQLGIIGYTANKTAAELFDEIFDNYNANNGEVTLDVAKSFFPHLVENMDMYEQLNVETGYIYDFLYGVATEYYGRKFMVAIPETSAAIEPDTLKVRVSQLPVESGFLDESRWATGIQNNLLPLEIDKFTEEDGKIVCFVRFNSGDSLNLSEINVDSIAFSSRNPQFGLHKLQNYSVFIKCSVENAVYFLDKNNLTGPKAIITLDGVVHQRVVEGDFPGKDIIKKFLDNGFSKAGINTDITQNPDYKTKVLDKVFDHIAQDTLNYGLETPVVTPDLAVIPLESQTQFYGPWYAAGTAGKLEFENDDSMVPWNYGGFDALNIAAYAKVTSAISTNQQLEQGEITFPEFPFHNIGQAIAQGGPLITDISCTMGDGGAHTTYKFKRNIKQPRYGQAKAERVATISRTQQQLRRAVRLGSKKKSIDLSRSALPIKAPPTNGNPKDKKTSSHEMICGQSFTVSETEKTSSVFIQSDYNFIGHAKGDYANKAFMSLDGLFRPFSTVQHSLLPHFEIPASDADFPTVSDLNPFTGVIDTKILAAGQNMQDNLYTNDVHEGNYRGLALRGPVIITGWGYDINDYPVPNLTPDDPTAIFLTEYKSDFSTWATGPLDIRWDPDRKVWATGGGGNKVIEGAMKTALAPNGSAVMNIWDSSQTVISEVYVHDFAGWSVGAGKYVIATKINGKYKLLVAEC